MIDRNGPRLVTAVLALALSSTLTACSANGSDADTADNGSSTSAAAAPSSPAASDCRLTKGGPAQGSTPTRSDASSFVKLRPGPAITPAEAAAEAPARRRTPLILSGTVYGADCRTPLRGAVIDVWQTDARGVYGPGQRAGNPRCCYLQGTVTSDSSGRYRIQTIRPGHYRGEDPPPPAHIHLNVHYRAAPGVLTEVVFAGDPYLAGSESTAEVIRLREDPGSNGKRLLGRFDIVLAETP